MSALKFSHFLNLFIVHNIVIKVDSFVYIIYYFPPLRVRLNLVVVCISRYKYKKMYKNEINFYGEH